MVVERYSHVMHITSNVSGQLREGLSAIEALRAGLPAGTVSGAPKVRAMEIIDSIEPFKRGPYGGAVGYIDFTGNMDTCIALRTLVIKDGTIYIQAGAGIVADSVPENEYHETLSKARAYAEGNSHCGNAVVGVRGHYRDIRMASTEGTSGTASPVCAFCGTWPAVTRLCVDRP